MSTLSIVLFACAGLLILATLSSLYVTNVTAFRSHTSSWERYLGIAAVLVTVAALLTAL